MKKQKIKVLGVIPARWGSTRFPGKSLAPLCGRPLIQWVIENAMKATTLDKLVVATDDRRIADAAVDCGVEAVMTSADHQSGTDRIAEAARKYSADIIVNIQGDEPTIDPKLINKLVNLMLAEKKWDMATAAAPLNSYQEAVSPTICKVVFDAEGQALYFSRYPIPFIREKTFSANEAPRCKQRGILAEFRRSPGRVRADQPAFALPSFGAVHLAIHPCDKPQGILAKANKIVFWRHIGLYLYRNKFLARFVAEPPCLLERSECLEQLRALHIGARIKVVQTSHCGIGVDTPADLAEAEAALKRKKSEVSNQKSEKNN